MVVSSKSIVPSKCKFLIPRFEIRVSYYCVKEKGRMQSEDYEISGIKLDCCCFAIKGLYSFSATNDFFAK